MADSAFKFLQDALVHLDSQLEQERKNMLETEQRLEEMSRNIEQYEREKKLIMIAMETFLHKTP